MELFQKQLWWLLGFSLLLGVPPAEAQVTDLIASEVGEDVVLTWSTGTPPFRVVRSLTPFFNQDNRLIAEGLFAFAATDVDAAGPTEHHYFYLVLGDGEPLPPGFITNPPPLIPFITSITPDSGAPGDVVVIDGGNIDPTRGSLRVYFEDADHTAEILSASETQLEVVVPTGTLTGGVAICSGWHCSRDLLFKRVIASGFEDISSMAFEPGTRSLWVADRGSVDRVFEVMSGKKPVERGSLAEPVLAHPSPADGTGRIYFSTTALSAEALLPIKYIDSPTNTEATLAQTERSGDDHQAVRCEAIAVNVLEPGIVYCLDGLSGSILRIVHGTVVDHQYGNRVFTFNSPAGARFDSKGNLYVSAMTTLFKILPQETGVVQLANGFIAAAGIDLWEEYDELLVADEATGIIWMASTRSDYKIMFKGGYSGPVAVTHSDQPDINYCDVAEPTRILRMF